MFRCHATSLSASGRQIRRHLVQAQTYMHASFLSSVWSVCLNPDAIDVKRSLSHSHTVSYTQPNKKQLIRSLPLSPFIFFTGTEPLVVAFTEHCDRN